MEFLWRNCSSGLETQGEGALCSLLHSPGVEYGGGMGEVMAQMLQTCYFSSFS